MFIMGGGQRNPTLKEIITNASLTANLQLCFDAGDGNSYAGSGQTWNDTSGTAQNFYLGPTSGAEAADPTFNGPVNGRAAGDYFGFNGSQYFLNTVTNPAWMDALHKAGARFSFLASVYCPSGGTGTLLADVQSVLQNSAGITLSVGGSGTSQTINLIQSYASGVSSAWGSWASDTGGIVQNAWNIVGGAIYDGGGSSASFFWANGVYVPKSAANTFAVSYTTPSSAAASYKMAIAARGDGSAQIASGSRLGGLAVWNTNLTKANLDAVWATFRKRYGL